MTLHLQSTNASAHESEAILVSRPKLLVAIRVMRFSASPFRERTKAEDKGIDL